MVGRLERPKTAESLLSIAARKKVQWRVVSPLHHSRFGQLAFALFAGVLLWPNIGQGQATDLPDESVAHSSHHPNPTATLSPLQDLQLTHWRERRREGWALLGMGLASAAAGIGLASFGHDDPWLVGFGLTTLSFAVINIPLGIGLMDIRDSRRQSIFGGALDLETAYRAQRGKRISFAVNTALDVLYMAAGGLLIALADRTRNENAAEGAGWAMISQGALLFGFDIYGLIATGRRMRSLTEHPNAP